MQAADFREFNRILTVAPAENNVPLGLFQDINAEYLAFPDIYCGQGREPNNSRKVMLHYSTICKWELRNRDRRVAKNISNIFFKLKKVQIKQISDKVSLAIRKCKLKGRKLTVKDVLNENSIENILKHDEGYKVLRTLRGSPPYWEQAKKDIFAMIRQLGIPTWFCSFSAAETKWHSLLRMLGSIIHGRQYSEHDISNLTSHEKCKLIKSDPVTCARYFDHRVQIFLTTVLQSDSHPIGSIKDYFYRVEFQQRGSPHIHMLIWVENAPSKSTHSHNTIVSFIDSYITCEKNEEMKKLINYQTHRHARTCRKKGKAICRFGFPIPPMKSSVILTGLDADFVGHAKAKKDYDMIMNELEKMKLADTNMTITMFLESINLSYDDYILALCSHIHPGKSKLFLKRELSEIRINNYNPVLLKCWESNMDIQYILDPYACAAYIVSYISKGQRGLSNLLSQATKAARESSSDIKQQVRSIGNVFLSHVKIGAQEAVYLLLQMPLRRASRQITFLNTNSVDKRVTLIKSTPDLMALPKDSTSIEADNSIKRYQRRPRSMEKYCLADFVAWFDVKYPCKSKIVPNAVPTCNDELPEYNYEIDSVDDPMIQDTEKAVHSNDSGDLHTITCREQHFALDGAVIKQRTKERVLYTVGFSINNDRENHFRELVMLYLPWRNESKLIDGFASYEEKYNKFSSIIEKNKYPYNRMSSVDFESLNSNLGEFTFDSDNIIVAEAQQQNELDELEGSVESGIYKCFDPGRPENDYDLALDLGIGRNQINGFEQVQGLLCDEEYRKKVQSLNKRQKEFFYHVLFWHKTQSSPIYNFLTGGAGVGKSVFLKCLYQALTKFYTSEAGENPENVKVLICAPTGKAAYNVGGVTIHSAFNIPAEQGFNFKPLDMQQLASFQTKYKYLKLVFIDEISMVGQKMFNFINLRLQEIMGTTKPFGGISVIAFGDLYQLKPVMDR